MQRQSTSRSTFRSWRVLVASLLCGTACSVITGTLVGDTIPPAIVGQPPQSPTRPLVGSPAPPCGVPNEMIVWGGAVYPSFFNTGGRYNPATDSWTATSTTNAPDSRYAHTAIWTGSEMIAWGGYDGSSYLHTGGRYNPDTNSWIATSTSNVPTGRSNHTAVWTGNEMIVWGGLDGSLSYVDTGGKHKPGTDTWTPLNTTNALLAERSTRQSGLRAK
jgi:hypothetical protein